MPTNFRIFTESMRQAGTYDTSSANNSLKKQQRINGVLTPGTDQSLRLIGVMSAANVADPTNGMDIRAQHSTDNVNWTTFAAARGWRGGVLLPNGSPAFPGLGVQSESLPEGGFFRVEVTTIKQWQWGMDLVIT